MGDGETREKAGRCLCGAVTVVARAAEPHVHACHCAMCRRWTGGPMLAVECGTDVSVEGAEHVRTFRSSDWAERAFCAECGTGLFYRLVGSGRMMLPAGLFDDAAGFELAGEIFVDEQPGWYAFAGERSRMTGAEVFALVASKEGDG